MPASKNEHPFPGLRIVYRENCCVVTFEGGKPFKMALAFPPTHRMLSKVINFVWSRYVATKSQMPKQMLLQRESLSNRADSSQFRISLTLALHCQIISHQTSKGIKLNPLIDISGFHLFNNSWFCEKKFISIYCH